MSDAQDAPSILPIHTEETILSIIKLHADHRATTTQYQRIVDHLTSLLGRPAFNAVLTSIIVGWLGLNALFFATDHWSVDPPPFHGLATAAALVSLYLVVLILTTQRRDDSLTKRRELLTLEIAILSEQKTTKVIELLEELRRDSPAVHDRVDQHADIMARPADPQSVIDAIKETRSEADIVSRRAKGA